MFGVVDPATGTHLLDIADDTSEDGSAPLAAAAAAQHEFARTPPRERREMLRRAFELLMQRREQFAALITLEMGKPLGEARGEVDYDAEFLRWFSEEAVRVEGRYAVAPDGRSPSTTKSPPGWVGHVIDRVRPGTMPATSAAGLLILGGLDLHPAHHTSTLTPPGPT
jgi:succinate-semialdehyde dehydrogenase/glutarate-semialdehyde dehydrogenase